MAIRLDPEQTDAQGLPVVTWEEDRNLFAPEGFGPARVACFIRPDRETGVLQFVAAGSVRHGPFEEARPWELLKSFEKGSADQLYYAASDRAALDLLASKSKSGAGRLLAADGALVMLANFGDARASVPTHLNCADASPVEVALLHDRLHREFIARRPQLVDEICGGEYIWPKDKPFIAFQPPAPAVIPRWKTWLVDLSIAMMLALIGWGFYEFVLR
ncbi:MAG: hypothetical protein ACLQU2_11675 [Candidatus Binataceae bacterium]